MDVDLLDPHGDTAVVPGASEAPGGAAAPRPGARWWWAITAAAAVALLVRLWAVRDRIEYSLWPDEPAQLAIARLVGDGAHWTMRNHSIWRPGYGTLLGPVYAVTDDPQAVYRTAMVLNAVLGAVAAALLVVLARRRSPCRPLRRSCSPPGSCGPSR